MLCSIPTFLPVVSVQGEVLCWEQAWARHGPVGGVVFPARTGSGTNNAPFLLQTLLLQTHKQVILAYEFVTLK